MPIVFIILVQTLAGLSAYLLLRDLTTQRAAVLGAAFYVINPNALLITYIRSDFAEQLACAFFPVLLLAALRLCNFLYQDNTAKRRSAAVWAILFAAVWLSNAPAGVIASYSMALLFVWAAFSQRSWRPLLRGAASLALGLGLAAFYIVPAAYQQRWVNIGQALSSGLLPSQNFLFTLIADPEHTWFNWIASICALALILLLALTALASRRLASPAKALNGNRGVVPALLLLGSAATFLSLRVSSVLWTYLPKLRFVQFPWRWMSIIALIACCFLAMAMERRHGWLWFVAILAFTLPLARFQVQNTWWDEDEMPTMRDALVTGQGFDGTDEYDPLGDDHADLPHNAPLTKILPVDSLEGSAPQANVQVQRWTAEQKQIHVETGSPVRLALRVLNYPVWRITVNGNPIAPQRMDDFNQMVIPIGAGSSEVRVRFTRTPDRWLGDAISLLGALIVAMLLWNRPCRPNH